MIKLIDFPKKNKLLVVVAGMYIFLAIFMRDKFIASFENSIYYVKEMLMIMPVILLLTALINAWVPKESIEKNLGKDSGVRGAIFSFLLGSFSAGPIYAAFPVSKTLISKGAGIRNIVILLSTWAVIKVPMLVNEAKFLGPKFMVSRWILTTIAIFIMGYIIPKFIKLEDIPKDDFEEVLEDNLITVRSEFCIGCGLCEKYAPDNFKIEDKKVILLKHRVNIDDSQKVFRAAEECPVKIINYSMNCFKEIGDCNYTKNN